MAGMLAQQTYSIGLKLKDASQSRQAIGSTRAYEDLKGAPQGTGFLVFDDDHTLFRSYYVSAPFIAPVAGRQQRRRQEGQYIDPRRFGAAVEPLPLDIEARWSNTAKLTRRDKQLLKQYAAAYDLPLEAFTQNAQLRVRDLLDALLLRVNVLPEALVLAQAASESAWGTSRFARQANNYFGQWCFSQGCGLVPKHRPEGATHEVAKFSSVAESVQAYFHNINTFTAYEALRTERAKQPQNVTAKRLLPTLLQYSERGEDYIKDLKKLIRQNRLDSNALPKATEPPHQG